MPIFDPKKKKNLQEQEAAVLTWVDCKARKVQTVPRRKPSTATPKRKQTPSPSDPVARKNVPSGFWRHGAGAQQFDGI